MTRRCRFGRVRGRTADTVPLVGEAVVDGCVERRFRRLFPTLAAAWLAALSGISAAAEPTNRSISAGNGFTHYAPYLTVELGALRSGDIRLVDGDDAGHAMLYGSAASFDAGKFGTETHLGLAAGVRMRSGLRAELSAGYVRGLDYRGNTNYRNAGERQPSEARMDTWQVFVGGYYEFSGWVLPNGRALRPVLGAGVGLTDYRLGDYVQRFPDPRDPGGYLRRGPGGEVPLTAIPDGSGTTFTWLLTAGLAVTLNKRLTLDLSYRHTDAGEIRTDVGDIAVVRYRADGTRRDIGVRVNETSTPFRTNALILALRFEL